MKDYNVLRVWGVILAVLSGLALFFPVSHIVFGVVLGLCGILCILISVNKEYWLKSVEKE